MNTINQTSIKSNSDEARPSLGKADTHKAQIVISKPWAIVEDPGRDSEWVRANFATYKEAFRTFKRWYDVDNMPEGTADIMKREADGTLTTEF